MADAEAPFRPWLTLPASRVAVPKLRCQAADGVRAALLICEADIPEGGGIPNYKQWRLQTADLLYVINRLVTRPHGVGDYAGAYVEVELTGLGGLFEEYNGTHLLIYDYDSSGYYVDVWSPYTPLWLSFARIYANPERCVVRVVPPGAEITWVLEGLDIEGTYLFDECTSEDNSCELSAGATCCVRWAGATWP